MIRSKPRSTVSPIAGASPQTPDGKKVYVCGRDGVYVINTSTNAVARKASGYGSSWDVAVNPVLNEYYVGVHATSADNYRPYILVINANTDTEVMRFNTSTDGTAMDLAVSPDGDKLYVCFQKSNRANFTVYDLSSRAYLSTKSILLPDDMAVSPDGKEVYVACADSENFLHPRLRDRRVQLCHQAPDRQPGRASRRGLQPGRDESFHYERL